MICKFPGSRLTALQSIVEYPCRWLQLAYAVRRQVAEAAAGGMIGLSLLDRGDISSDPQTRAGSDRTTSVLSFTKQRQWRRSKGEGRRENYVAFCWAYHQEKAFCCLEGVLDSYNLGKNRFTYTEYDPLCL